MSIFKDKNKKEDLEKDYENIVNANAEQTELGKVTGYNMGEGTATTVTHEDLMGYIELDVNELPSKGKFYPTDFQLYIRAAKVAEIRDFSLINEQLFTDIEEKLNAITKACTKFKTTTGFQYKDLIEEDRFYILINIRDLTFPQPEQRLKCPVPGTSDEIEITSKNLQMSKLPEYIEERYSEEEKCFIFKFKSGRVYKMRPPTIGVMTIINDYIVTNEKEGKLYDKGSLQLIPYIYKNWREVDKKFIRNFATDMLDIPASEASAIFKICSEMKVGVTPELKHINAEGDETLVPLTFPDGLKSLFTVQDITSELL